MKGAGEKAFCAGGDVVAVVSRKKKETGHTVARAAVGNTAWRYCV